MEEIEVRAFLRLLSRQKWLILAVTLVCVLTVAVVVLHFMPREYVASSTLLYSDSTVSSAAGALAGSLGLPVALAQTGPASWYETILTSRRLAQLMVVRHGLTRVLQANDDREAVQLLQERLSITAKPEAKALLLRVRLPGTPLRRLGAPLDHDRAKLAAAVANDLVAELEQWLRTTDYQSSTRQRQFIEDQLQRALSELATTRRELLRVFGDTGVFAPEAQGQQWLSALNALEQELAATRSQLRGNEVSQAAGQAGAESKRLAGGADARQQGAAILDSLRGQLATLEVDLRRETEANKKTDEHPDVTRLQQSIREVQEKIVRELAIVTEARKLEEERLSRQLADSQQRWGKLQTRLQALPSQGLQVEELRRELAGQTGMVDLLSKQLIMAAIAEQQQTERFTVLDQALPPRQPVSPSPLRSLAVALVAGLLLGVLLGAVREAWRGATD